MPLLVFLASLLPGVAYLWLVYRLDRYEPEPKGWVALIFFLGMAAAVLGAAAHELVGQVVALLGADGFGHVDAGRLALRYLLVVAPFEEGLKLLAFLAAFSNRRLFNEPVDGLVYAAAAALGFASLENALYALEYGADLLIWRAILAVPMHLIASAFFGLGLAYARLVRGGWRGRAVAVGSFFLAIVLHGSYDLLVHAQGRWAAGALLLLGAVALVVPVRVLRKRSPFRHSVLPPEEVALLAACPSCGAAGRTGQRCPSCEVRLVPIVDDGPGEPPLRILWVVVAIAILGLGAFGAAALATVVGGTWSLVSAAAVALLGSMAVGRLSPGVTLAEPAVAGMAATVIYLLLVGGRLGPALVLSPVGLVLAVLGAWIGERWQGSGRSRQRGSVPPG